MTGSDHNTNKGVTFLGSKTCNHANCVHDVIKPIVPKVALMYQLVCSDLIGRWIRSK